MTIAKPDGVVIVGSGLGGYTLARELRKLAKDLAVTIVTADGGEAYSKPMLSNALAQNKSPDQLVQKPAAAFAADLGVTIRTRTRVAAIDRARKVLALDDGSELAYGRLVLALGADPRPYGVAGGDAVTIATVNDFDDYRRWRDGLANGPARVLLIGAGLIGCEFANDLAAAGHAVTLVEPGPWPVARLLPEQIGRKLADSLAGIGVTMKLGVAVERVAPGRALLSDGADIAFDHALSAIGLVPRIALAEAAGLVIDRGIRVDRHLRTSDPAIFALGDCAATEAGPLPFVLPLMAEARALAATLAGTETALVLPALPVAVKTPCLPVVVCPPPPGIAGEWTIEGEGRDLTALFTAPDGTELGFALSGAAVSRRQVLASRMPALLN
jgi:rubredoxin-NAD+ reductase